MGLKIQYKGDKKVPINQRVIETSFYRNLAIQKQIENKYIVFVKV